MNAIEFHIFVLTLVTIFSLNKQFSVLEHNLTKPRYFQSTCVIETGLSDFRRMIVSVLKMLFRKFPATETLKSLKMKGL